MIGQRSSGFDLQLYPSFSPTDCVGPTFILSVHVRLPMKSRPGASGAVKCPSKEVGGEDLAETRQGKTGGRTAARLGSDLRTEDNGS